jgi:tellurite resistance protein TerC
MATPLLLAVVAAETADLVFALDSIPAVFAVTDDPFLVFSSNICAILGLRALYFVVSGAISRLHYLKPGLAAILLFVGAKMVLYKWVHLPTGTSLAIIAAILAVALAASLLRKPEPAKKDEPG